MGNMKKKCIALRNGFICTAQTEIACLECGCVIDVEERIYKSKHGHCRPSCPTCGLRMDVWQAIDGSLHCYKADKQSRKNKKRSSTEERPHKQPDVWWPAPRKARGTNRAGTVEI